MSKNEGQDDDFWTKPPGPPGIVFGPGADDLLDAQLDWIRGDAGPSYYVDAYREAAEKIYEQAVEGAMVVERAVLPLAQNWRHHIELALKDVIVTGREFRREDLTKKELKALGRHDLLVLWGLAKEHIDPLGPRDAEEPKNVEAHLCELKKIDLRGDGFRYHLNYDRTERTLGDAPQRVNIVKMHERMEETSNFLLGIRIAIASNEASLLDYEMREYRHADRETIREMRRIYIDEHRRDREPKGEAPPDI